MVLSVGLLAFSLLGIAGLFSLKNWEEKSGRTLVAGLRAEADVRALDLKALLYKLQGEIEKLPSHSVRAARIIVHDLALGFAGLAASLETYAHRLADMVSHKHRFERRESKNEFLKRVGEPKNGNGFETD